MRTSHSAATATPGSARGMIFLVHVRRSSRRETATLRECPFFRTSSAPSVARKVITPPTMTTIPARLAKMSGTSGSMEEARRGSINAYRQWYRSVSGYQLMRLSQLLTVMSITFSSPHILLSRRSTHFITLSSIGSQLRSPSPPQAPEIVSLYSLSIPPSMIRLKIRQDFERNRHINDLGIIDMLLHKNQQEYQETMNCWKQEVSRVSLTPSSRDGSLCPLTVCGMSPCQRCVVRFWLKLIALTAASPTS